MAELQQLSQERGVPIELLPGKTVHTRKAQSGAFRSRAVICGNYASSTDDDVYAGGTDSTQVRSALKTAALRDWLVMGTDVRTAFLNARRRDESKLVAMSIPSVFKRLGLANDDDVWIVEMALYGLTTSPKDWGVHRDATLKQLTWSRASGTGGGEVKGHFEKSDDENLWRLIETDSNGSRWCGLLCVYVDDWLFCGEEQVLQSALKAVETQWACAEAEWATETKALKFCGMEITVDSGGNGLHLSQSGYEKELLERWQVDHAIDVPQFKINEFNNNGWGERGQLKFQRSQHSIEVFSDIAYAAGSNHRSVQGIAVFFAGSPVAWQSSQQPFVTHSTAEAELVGRATEALLCAMWGEPLNNTNAFTRTLYGDNMAAIGLASGNTCASWRTRHLRIRAAILKEALDVDCQVPGGIWQLLHLKGTELVADGLTKQLLGQAFTKFVEDLGLKRAAKMEPSCTAEQSTVIEGEGNAASAAESGSEDESVVVQSKDGARASVSSMSKPLTSQSGSNVRKRVGASSLPSTAAVASEASAAGPMSRTSRTSPTTSGSAIAAAASSSSTTSGNAVAAAEALGADIALTSVVTARVVAYDLISVKDLATVHGPRHLTGVNYGSRRMVLRKVKVGEGAFVGPNCTMEPGCEVAPAGYVEPLSTVSAGTLVEGRVTGVPAQVVGPADLSRLPSVEEVEKVRRNSAVVALGYWLLLLPKAMMPFMLVVLFRLFLGKNQDGVYDEQHSLDVSLTFLVVAGYRLQRGPVLAGSVDFARPSLDALPPMLIAQLPWLPLIAFVASMVHTILQLLITAVLCRKPPCTYPLTHWRAQLAGLKMSMVLQAAEMLADASIVPAFIRLCGAKMGPGCVMGLQVTLPETLEVGQKSFFATGNILTSVDVDRGQFKVPCITYMGNQTFLGNHNHLPEGLPDTGH
eukprot:s1855_g2.t1